MLLPRDRHTGWGLWRLASWVASGGRLPLRGRRPSASGFGAAGLSGQAFYQPSVKQVLEQELRDAMRREEDDQGDAPHPDADAVRQPSRLGLH